MTEQQYKWQCPICSIEINFSPEPLPESLTLQIVEEVRKLNANSYLMIIAERSQHIFNHAIKGEGIGALGQIKKELEREEPKEDLDDNTEQPSVDTSEGPGDDTQDDSESA